MHSIYFLLLYNIRCKNAQHGEKVRLGSVLEDSMFIIIGNIRSKETSATDIHEGSVRKLESFRVNKDNSQVGNYCTMITYNSVYCTCTAVGRPIYLMHVHTKCIQVKASCKLQ